MIEGLDSSFDAPTDAAASSAQAAGVRLWSGYLALPGGGQGLACPWTRDQFDRARRCGGTPLGFCSGNDDPQAIAQLGRDWRVRPCLDVEPHIRDDGPWVQQWLDLSGAGLYGLAAVHAGRTARFHVVADYPGFPVNDTWPSFAPRPSGPVGWQFQGSHFEFGGQVDRGLYDDWFATEENGMDEPTAIVWHHTIQEQLFGFVDPSGQASFVDAIMAGVPINAIWDGWNTLPAAAAWSAAKARALADVHPDLGQLSVDLQKVVDDLKAAQGGGGGS